MTMSQTFYVFSEKHRKMLFLPCFFLYVYVVKAQVQTFFYVPNFFYISKSLPHRNILSHSQILKNEGKSESQHFSMLRFLDGQAYNLY